MREFITTSTIKCFVIVSLLILSLGVVACGSSASKTLRLATTTSTADSGLLDVLLPAFEKKHDIKVEYVAVGTGQAVELGRRGDADVILVHNREREDKFVAEGHGMEPIDVMYNDFVILGPQANPAAIRGLTSAFKRFAEAKVTFVSRGDESGTHAKEKYLWSSAGIEPSGEWYLSSGQGMAGTLNLASEKEAYTLSDRGTYLALKAKLRLTTLVEGDEVLFNPYRIIAVNPARHSHVDHASAKKLIQYLVSDEGQRIIGEFGKDTYGQPLFIPNAN